MRQQRGVRELFSLRRYGLSSSLSRYKDRRVKAEGLDAAGDGADLLAAVFARIFGIAFQLVEREPLETPACGRRHAGRRRLLRVAGRANFVKRELARAKIERQTPHSKTQCWWTLRVLCLAALLSTCYPFTRRPYLSLRQNGFRG
jgi:hypothetical protein